MSLITGETVKVWHPIEGEPDEMGEPSVTFEGETVTGVLFEPGVWRELAAARPNGARCDATFHIPKAYDSPLQGCEIERLDRRYRIVGDPQPYGPDVPGPWNRAVLAVVCDG
ncbi:hypothetical protein [Adlercreutzia sp. ZJ141]|uniref:hypothetical protein n=1 Tax=Adlercreutzia sp. ZJ141 TaxID=2709406 RepID=UPI0013E9BD2D|nr:hypothetical protein [Adlercreutzia sp. ZJ141]